MQLCVVAGIEVLALHHQRKGQAENKKPKKLADVYGSRWLTAGCGSVVMLWGEAGDPVVELTHLKQPADEVGPLTLLHDNTSGTTTLLHGADVVELLWASDEPLTAKQVATALFGMQEPKENEIAKAKRRLRAAVQEGKAEQLDTAEGEAALWGFKQGADARGGRGWTPDAAGEGGRTPYTPEGGKGRTPPVDADGDGGDAEAEPESLTAAVSASANGSDEGGDEAWLREMDAAQASIDPYGEFDYEAAGACANRSA
jgi:hypothetical protein